MGIDLVRYDEEKEKLKVLVCDECEKEFLLKGVNIEQQIITDKKNGLWFNYKYFRCPHCGQPYIVCIDDELSLSLETLYEAQYNRVIRRKARNKCKEKDVERLGKKRKALLKRRDMLLKQYKEVFTEITKTKLGENISTMTNNMEKEKEVK